VQGELAQLQLKMERLRRENPPAPNITSVLQQPKP